MLLKQVLQYVETVAVEGSLDRGTLQSLERRINRARAEHVNFLILVLDCVGGTGAAADERQCQHRHRDHRADGDRCR